MRTILRETSSRSIFEMAGHSYLLDTNVLSDLIKHLSLGCTLVTDNVGEFSGVAGLKVENWLET